MVRELLLMSHVIFGVLALLIIIWFFIAVLNIKKSNRDRIRLASILQMICMWLTYLFGGAFYIIYYGPDRALIKASKWSFAHNFVMEAKEHVFLMLLLLSTYLFICVYNNDLLSNKHAKKLSLWVAGSIAVLTLGMEIAGLVISFSIKMAMNVH